MEPYCYRFNTRQQFLRLAKQAGLIVADPDGTERLITASHAYSIDEIGTIYVGGAWGPDGKIITPPTALAGWHVNTINLAPEAWDEYLIIVNSCSCQWFGGPTSTPGDDVLEAIS